MAKPKKEEAGTDKFDVVAISKPTFFEKNGMLLFSGLAFAQAKRDHRLGDRLYKAAIDVPPVAYLAGTYMQTLVIGLLALLVAVAGILTTSAGDPVLIVAFLLIPVLAGVLTYSFRILQPDIKAKARARNIEENLPYAMNFLAAMAGAGVLPVEMFGALANQTVYGELRREAHHIYRDCKLVSMDLVQALRLSARRTPSKGLEEVLMGSVNTITSGGDLRQFLLSRADYLAQEQRRKQRAFIEGLGVMSESYVVVGSAAPLFLLVVVSILTLVNSSGADPAVLLGLIIFLGLPIIHLAFGYLIGNLTAD